PVRGNGDFGDDAGTSVPGVTAYRLADVHRTDADHLYSMDQHGCARPFILRKRLWLKRLFLKPVVTDTCPAVSCNTRAASLPNSGTPSGVSCFPSRCRSKKASPESRKSWKLKADP